MGFYLRQFDNLTNSKILFCILLTLIVFFSHIVSFFQLLLFLFFFHLIKYKDTKFGFKQICIVLPSLVLLFIYLITKESSTLNKGSSFLDFSDFSTKIFDLLFLQNFSNFNYFESKLFGIIGVYIFLLLFYLFVKKSNYTDSDFLLKAALLISSLILYLFISDELLGGMHIRIRMQLLVYIFAIWLISNEISISSFLRNKMFVFLFLLIITTNLFLRFRKQVLISSCVKEYVRAKDYICDNSVVLPVGLSNKGEFDSNPQYKLSKRLSIFKHISGYLGSYKDIIILDNYEANMGYFPIKWKSSVNPYKLLVVDSTGSIDENPPNLNITEYENVSKINLDYILVFGDQRRFIKNECWMQLRTYILVNGELKYCSKDGLTRLYKLKKGLNRCQINRFQRS
jgi:hypothetical protein